MGLTACSLMRVVALLACGREDDEVPPGTMLKAREVALTFSEVKDRCPGSICGVDFSGHAGGPALLRSEVAER